MKLYNGVLVLKTDLDINGFEWSLNDLNLRFFYIKMEEYPCGNSSIDQQILKKEGSQGELPFLV